MAKMIQHDVQRFGEMHEFSCRFLLRISHFDWFTSIFSRSGDTNWIIKIAASVRFQDLSSIQLLLMDQIVFSRSMESLQFWLKFTHDYLEGMGYRYSVLSTMERHVWPNTLAGLGGSIYSLREILLWVLKSSVSVHSSVVGADGRWKDYGLVNLELIAAESRKEARDKGKDAYMIPQSFEFVEILSQREWEEWIATVKGLLAKLSLRGTITGATVGSGTYLRDPEGICSRMEIGDVKDARTLPRN
jgi:hypothetical protein